MELSGAKPRQALMNDIDSILVDINILCSEAEFYAFRQYVDHP